MALSLSSLAQIAVPQANINSDVTPQLSSLFETINKGQQQAERRQALAALGDGTGNVDIRPLLASGDMSLAQLGIALRNRQQDLERQGRLDQRQTARDGQSDKQWAASYELQKAAAARAAEDKYSIQKVEDPNTGAVSFVRINTRGPEGVISTGAPAPSQPNNPFSAGGKFNEGQGKAAGFTDRMLQSEGILSGINGETGVQGQGTSLWQAGVSSIPGVGNYLTSTDRQKFEQAKRDFVNAQLRRESGAAISASEFDSANKQYFPVPGDTPEVIAQKAANRRAAIEAIGREGGPSYRPKYTFDPSGRVTPYGQPARGAQSSQPVTKSQYDSLPSGATFTAPDGSLRVKP